MVVYFALCNLFEASPPASYIAIYSSTASPLPLLHCKECLSLVPYLLLEHTARIMSFFSGITSAVSDLTSNITHEIENITGQNSEEQTADSNTDQKASVLPLHVQNNRFNSFAPIRHTGNDAKWYVDGCGYMWAVSVAIEEARESIWILDWWLTPELYLRRPPTQNESYRIDRMLLAAAERGVKVNVIIYKEVAAVLTCAYFFSYNGNVLTRISVLGSYEKGPPAARQHLDLQTPRSCSKRPGH